MTFYKNISLEAGKKTIAEAYRVLRPGGFFCLDTPNRYITEIHTEPNGGGFIHPEHKIEYYPEQLRSIIERAGFSIAVEKGICAMPKTLHHKQFFYEELVLNEQVSDNVKASYMQFLVCVKPEKTNFKKGRTSKNTIKKLLKRVTPRMS